MRFAVSNIAWRPDERRAAYARLQAAGVTGLEIAPGLFFADSADPFAPTDAELAAATTEIAAAGLAPVSMQSLLFGVEGAALFGDGPGREAFGTGIARAIDLAGRLGIPNLVLGSPKQRLRPEGMATDTAMNHARDILLPLAERARAAGTVIAMECNPADYGANFLVTPEETLAFVRHAAHPAITLNFDLGAAILTGTAPRVEHLLEEAGPTISHVHLSEPHLAPAPAGPDLAARVIAALRRLGYKAAVSIEMRRPDDGLVGLDTSLRYLGAARDMAARDP